MVDLDHRLRHTEERVDLDFMLLAATEDLQPLGNFAQRLLEQERGRGA
jgi:hypothetical protein